MEQNTTKKIGSLQFGVVSPRYIKKISKIEVLTPELYDTDGYPVDNGLMDSNMGVIDPGLRCKTCGGGLKTCPGHFGHISLAKPVLHIAYVKHIYDLLRLFCSDCGRILLNDTDLNLAKAKAEKAREEYSYISILPLRKKVLKKTQSRKKCPYCDAEQKPIKLDRPSMFFEDGQRLWPDDIKARFEKVLDDDLLALGFDPKMVHPDWLVLTTLSVPPITIRPSITLESGDRSEDDLTHKLSDIVRVNQRLSENISAGAPEIIIEDLWDLLQYHLTTYFNNKVAGIPPARHRTNRELKTLTQRLSGKTGRFRHSLTGKRVNFCGRSVISPDLNISIGDVGIPLQVAKEVTIPETITSWNKKWLIGLMKNAPNYPGANYIISPDGRRRKITKETCDALIEELEEGWMVERHLLNGDAVLFNRQPSLHRMSMMCHTVKVLPGRTFRINPSVCPPYNADFDGDEMNLHVPQTEEARAEAKNVAKVDYNLITPRYGLSIIGQTKDMLMGLYVLTDDLTLDRQSATQLVIDTGLDVNLPIKKQYAGKEIASLVFPSDFNFSANDIEIKKGVLVKGMLTNKYIGAEGGLLIHKINAQYGAKKTAKFLDTLQQLALAVVRMYPYSLSFEDLRSDQVNSKIKKEVENAEKDAVSIIDQYNANKIIPLPGISAKETMEIKVLDTLNSARNKVGELIEKENKGKNDLMLMIKSKTGGKILNLAQISGFVGQQALRGSRIMAGYKGRVLPHFKTGDLGPGAHGFVRSSYKSGLSPLELYFNCIVGRDSYIDTAMRTPKSGYLQRRLINALQDLKVNYDGTVRDAGQNIIQFSYGGDAIDVSKSDHGSVKKNG
jgi:DNA-directed RNA polymerase subunit A'